jgi:hypothetical protein
VTDGNEHPIKVIFIVSSALLDHMTWHTLL